MMQLVGRVSVSSTFLGVPASGRSSPKAVAGAARARAFTSAGRPSRAAFLTAAAASDGLSQAETQAQGAADDLNRQLDAANQQAKDLDSMGPGRGVQGDMLEKSPSNNNKVRGIVILAALAAAARATGFMPARGAAFVHLLAWGCVMGANLWVTFIAGITMFKNLPRQTFGKIQSKLFPQFFWLNTGASLICIGSLAYSGAGILRPQLITLGIALAGSLLNLLFVEPKATNLMFQRYALENAEQRDNEQIKQLYKQFGKWHGLSSTLNLGVLAAIVVHGWWLAAAVVL